MNLFKKQGLSMHSLKDGLGRNKDYKMSNLYVWNLLHSIYGGGPLIVRKEKDIYIKKKPCI
jgi:hypothetical protein